MPSAWPGDESTQVTGAFLTDPLVTEALAYVNAVVPAQYLNIAPSKFVSPCVATYSSTAAAVTNCYWPNALCSRTTATAAYFADIVTCPNQNQWGLTYDDGPTFNVVNGVNTNDSIDLRNKLKSMGTKATFFVVGANGVQDGGAAEIKAQYEDGHQLGIHTWSHWTSTALTNAELVAELKYTEALIYNATGVLPTMWRPPCGDVDDRVRAIASALGFHTVVWTTTPVRDDTAADLNTQTAAEVTSITNTVKTWFTAQPGFISLEHDIDPFTTSVDIAVLDAVVAEGAAFPLQQMPVGTCMGLPFYKSLNGTTTTVPASSVVAAASTTTAAASVSTASTTTTPAAVAVAAAASSASSVASSLAAKATGATTADVTAGAAALSGGAAAAIAAVAAMAAGAAL
ncbi:chitin deacetylase [Thoreauomyces humboldtii]|nr:chitin deacetylase [Thoreauomyces humboldtii]